MKYNMLILTTIVGFTIANALHVFTEWWKNSPGQVFHAIAHSYPDYFLYLSYVAQGASGSIIFTSEQFTDERLPKTALYWVYSLIGGIGHLLGLVPQWSYVLSLLILCIVLLSLWYRISWRLNPINRAHRFTMFLVIISASPFILSDDLWFSPAPAFNRLGGVPHQIAQTILLLSVLFCLVNAKKIGSVLLLLAVSFLATASHPLQMVLLLTASGITGILTKNSTLIFVTIASGIAGLPAALSVNHDYATPIYTIAKQWELQQYKPMGVTWWISVIGPIVLFIPFGLWPFLKKKDPFRLIFFFYGVISFLAYNSPLSSLLGVVSQRFLHPAPYALFPILAVFGFVTIQKDLPGVFRTLFTISAIVFYAFFTVPADIQQIALRVNDPHLAQVSWLNHTPQQVINDLASLKRITQDASHDVVLAEKNLGVDLLIPLYTGKTSFMGQAIHTLHPDVKEQLRNAFFSGTMSREEKQKFLTDHRIGYVLTKTTQGIHIEILP